MMLPPDHRPTVFLVVAEALFFCSAPCLKPGGQPSRPRAGHIRSGQESEATATRLGIIGSCRADHAPQLRRTRQLGKRHKGPQTGLRRLGSKEGTGCPLGGSILQHHAEVADSEIPGQYVLHKQPQPNAFLQQRPWPGSLIQK